MEFKYTATRTPQQNGHTEWMFVTRFNLVHAMLNTEKFTAFLRNGIWAETINTNTLLENNLVTPNKGLSPF